MSPDSKLSLLCRLVDNLPEPETTKTKERDLLISLSQILKVIQTWIRELDKETESKKICYGESVLHHEEHSCLIKIVTDLMLLLTVESQYVQHSVGNVLVVFSEFVALSGSGWDSFIHSLSTCLELAIANVFLCSWEPSRTEVEDSNCDFSSYEVVKSSLKGGDWSTAAGIVRVLRNILKHLKQECDDQLLEVYLGSVSSFLSNVPWESMDEIHVDQSCDAWDGDPQNCCSKDASVFRSFGAKEPKVLFLGIFIQFLCSLVEQSSAVETEVGSQVQYPVLSMVISLVPKLACWCLCKKGKSVKLSVSQYFRHKLLRQTLLLFLRCCFSLMSFTGETSKQCVTSKTILKSCLTVASVSDLDYCSRNKGLLELYNWLQGHLPDDILVDHERYLEKCMGFSLSFLQLYMHEDDVLFMVLLQLLSVPFCSEQWLNGEKQTSQYLKDATHHVSNLFNPVHLFHLFLAELHYDHQVLLDYLISKDVGISCAEYLLRCLRMVHNSWNVFATFSMDWKVVNQSCCKKRRLLLDVSDFQGELSSIPEQCISQSLEEEDEKEFEYTCENHQNKRQPFKEAKDCLISLKASVESLHRKNLFPYNPLVLLKRLSQFQELCHS
ncbi:uncharacterized protein LOC112323265 isoform X3 [Populus trichocarpa]|uniref:Protein Lines C-terminal domain-containing protein n=1 Tax=Populus trichocarpa TaxID=3694 RepID=A0A3N7GF35_POPTR|nr:uncharacterized protein LOC112323265 isoform X3 [Populus trichocarpa]|eukprot:XP_024456206.1 uncharacterized protein LOC112323265 isoform X3 [Populus trichocarpa]